MFLQSANEMNKNKLTRNVFKIFNMKNLVKVICFFILFYLHFLGIVILSEFLDNIVFYGKEYENVFDKGIGMGAVFIALIISIPIILISLMNSNCFEKFYSFFLVIPIFCYLCVVCKIGERIIGYYNIPSYLGVAEMINLAVATTLFVITKFLFLRIKNAF